MTTCAWCGKDVDDYYEVDGEPMCAECADNSDDDWYAACARYMEFDDEGYGEMYIDDDYYDYCYDAQEDEMSWYVDHYPQETPPEEMAMDVRLRYSYNTVIAPLVKLWRRIMDALTPADVDDMSDIPF